MRVAVLSTSDNPYDPFTDFKQWYLFDVSHGYNSCGITASNVDISDDVSEVDFQKAVEDAIDEIIRTDFMVPNRIKLVKEVDLDSLVAT